MRRGLLTVAFGSAVVFCATVEASDIEQCGTSRHKGSAYWVPGQGDWADSAHWSGGMVPGLGLDFPDVLIDARTSDITHVGGAGDYAGDRISSQVGLSLSVQVADLFLGPMDVVSINGGSILFNNYTTAGILIYNGGEIDIYADSASAGLTIANGKVATLEGDGLLNLTHPTLSHVRGQTGNETLKIANGTVQGAGMLGLGKLALVNNDTIDANLSFKRLTIEPSSAGIQNNGTIRSSNRARLQLRNALVDNVSGIIEAVQSSSIDLDNTSIQGGAIHTDADSSVRNLSAPAAMFDIEIDGNVEVGEAQLTLGGAIVNNGLIICNGDTETRGGALPVNPSQIVIPNDGGTQFTGAGRVDLEVGSIWSGQTGVTATLTNTEGHTISGRGNIGNDTLCITNNGTIIADGETPLILDPCDQIPFENNGTLSAIGTGVLFLVDGTFQNHGTIEVAEGGQVVLLPGASLANSLAGGLTGGKWIIRGSNDLAELILLSINDLTTNMADVTLDGPLSRFDRINPIQYNFGGFHLLNGRVFSTTGDFVNAAMLEVDAHSTLNTNGRLTFNSAGTVMVGVSNDNNGTLHATTRASLGGTLELVLEPGATWEVGREIEIISGNQITGQFAQVIAPGRFDLNIESNAVVIVPKPACIGDFDNDDIVDITDLLVVIDQWGTCLDADDCPADLDHSSVVDVNDLLQVLSHWGACP